MRLWKWVDKDLRTHEGFQWQVGKWVETSGTGDLCSAGWIHAYEHPLLAVLHKPIHVASYPRLFLCEGDGKIRRDGQIKIGVSRLRLLREVEALTVTNEQRIRYAILCAAEVYAEESWLVWATNWWVGLDRSASAASAAEEAADAARAAWAAASLAARAADAAAEAAGAAAWAAWAAAAEAWAARAARRAARRAAAANKQLDLIALAERAMQDEPDVEPNPEAAP